MNRPCSISGRVLAVGFLLFVALPVFGVAQRPQERFASWSRPGFPPAEYQARRTRLMELLRRGGGGVFLIPSGSGSTTGDTFRQADNFLYFTGLELPKSMLWVDGDRGAILLFTPDRDPRWENSARPNDFPGRLLGADPAVRTLAAVDSVLPADSLAPWLDRLARTGRPLWLDRAGAVGGRPALIPEEGFTPDLEVRLAMAARYPHHTVRDGSAIIARLRMVKSPAEVAAIGKSVDAAMVAMRRAVAGAQAGVTERTLIGQFEAECRREGAARVPFTPIVKSGPNALWPWRILASHYDRRDRALASGDMVIFDVGCELDYYASDLGRSFPVGGRFSPAQRRAVELVTTVSDSILAAIRPGVTFAALQRTALAAIPQAERRFMQTGSYFGHHIGLSAGDPSNLEAPLATGMVFTVEPWYYNHGTGIAAFIEDNVVVTDAGVRVLSAALPRAAAELERMIGGGGPEPSSVPALPEPLTNHAVAGGVILGRWQIFAMLGVDSTKRWRGIHPRGWTWREGADGWRELPPVPGPLGRLAATAQVVRGRVYLFGGYTVDSSAAERSVPAVDIYDPALDRWTAGAPIPVPVDDAVSGVYRDSLIYLVSGWHDSDNVRNVQVYDVAADRWSTGTSILGAGVFGHGGGIAGDRAVYIDGAIRNTGAPRYVNQPQSWLGSLSPGHPDSVAWRRLADHPGPARYRPAVGSCGPYVVFAGGTDNPYNYNGIGYDGQPSKPLAEVMALDTRTGEWRALAPAPVATMDHRGLLIRGDTAWIVGGMQSDQRVRAEVTRWTLGICPP